MKNYDKLFSSGFEFLLLSSERIENVISEMIDSKKIDRKEAISLRKSLIEKSQNEKKKFIKDLEKLILSEIKDLGFVKKEDFVKLENRINSIETYINEQARINKQSN